jgi:hypothetical protein
VSSSQPNDSISDIVWDNRCENSRYQYYFDDGNDIELDLQWLTENERAQREYQERDTQLRQHHKADTQLDMPEQGETVDPDFINETPSNETHVEPRGESNW